MASAAAPASHPAANDPRKAGISAAIRVIPDFPKPGAPPPPRCACARGANACQLSLR
jgi:hypothetical protein